MGWADSVYLGENLGHLVFRIWQWRSSRAKIISIFLLAVDLSNKVVRLDLNLLFWVYFCNHILLETLCLIKNRLCIGLFKLGCCVYDARLVIGNRMYYLSILLYHIETVNCIDLLNFGTQIWIPLVDFFGRWTNTSTFIAEYLFLSSRSQMRELFLVLFFFQNTYILCCTVLKIATFLLFGSIWAESLGLT